MQRIETRKSFHSSATPLRIIELIKIKYLKSHLIGWRWRNFHTWTGCKAVSIMRITSSIRFTDNRYIQLLHLFWKPKPNHTHSELRNREKIFLKNMNICLQLTWISTQWFCHSWMQQWPVHGPKKSNWFSFNKNILYYWSFKKCFCFYFFVLLNLFVEIASISISKLPISQWHATSFEVNILAMIDFRNKKTIVAFYL